MNRRDWVLLALQCAGGHGLSPVQLQKSLFLLGAEMRGQLPGEFYDFIPHNYGPFAKQIYQDAEILAGEGLVAIERKEQSFPTYTITAAGDERAREVRREAPAPVLQYLAEAIAWTQRQSFQGLIRAIYDKYPQYRVNSVFQY